jgi:SAM-dependent methyltransferase
VEELPSPQVDPSHYFRGYDSLARFASYWHQIEETCALGGDLLEIGVGNGTVSAVLRAKGLTLTTVDLDSALRPDVVADIRALPFDDGSFDTVLAAEVLEHIPWDETPDAVAEIARVARRGVVISVPDSRIAFTMESKLPNAFHIGRLAIRRRIPLRDALWGLLQAPSWRRHGGTVSRQGGIGPRRRDLHPSCAEHFWEIGRKGLEPPDLGALFEAEGLELARDFRVQSTPYHHFFVFEVAARDAED